MTAIHANAQASGTVLCSKNVRSVGIEVGMEVDVCTEIGLRLVVVSSFVH